MTLMPPESSILTIEYKANFLAPALGETLLARGHVIRPGRTVTVCAGDVVAVDGRHEKLVATLLATMMRVSGERLAPSPAVRDTSTPPIAVHSRRNRRWCLCRPWKTQVPDSTALV